MREACYYERQPDDSIICRLCPHHCRLQEGQAGRCLVRQVKGGTLYAANYAVCAGLALDPIEKKPLYHFYPGGQILSLGSWGCNFSCRFCQNWQIARQTVAGQELTPAAALALAERYVAAGNIGLAYTYNEPLVGYEYVRETAALVQAAGLQNVLVTNGFICREPLSELLPYIAALNIDVKAFREEFYQKQCGGRLAAVQQTVAQAVAAGCHVEVTTLVIPGGNDAVEDIEALAAWLAALSPDIPLHLTRYFPQYQATEPPTPLATLEQAAVAARRQLRYVYIGNCGNDAITYCPGCGVAVINRAERRQRLAPQYACPVCGTSIALTGKVLF